MKQKLCYMAVMGCRYGKGCAPSLAKFRLREHMGTALWTEFINKGHKPRMFIVSTEALIDRDGNPVQPMGHVEAKEILESVPEVVSTAA